MRVATFFCVVAVLLAVASVNATSPPSSPTYQQQAKEELIHRFAPNTYAARSARVVRHHLASGLSLDDAQAKADAHVADKMAQRRQSSANAKIERKRLRDEPQLREQRKEATRKAAFETASSAAGVKQPAFMMKLKASSSSSSTPSSP